MWSPRIGKVGLAVSARRYRNQFGLLGDGSRQPIAYRTEKAT